MRARPALLVLALALTVPLAGCVGGDAPVTTVPPAEAFEEDVGVARGNGTFAGESRVARVLWENGHAEHAVVNVTINLTQGSVTLRILDGNGFPVFERAFTGENEGTITSGRGAYGRWAVTLDAKDAKGEWRVEAKPL